MAIAPAYTGTGQPTGDVPSGANPYGIDPTLMALLQQTGTLGQSLTQALPNAPGTPGAGGAGFQRQASGAPMVQGSPNNLLLAILQMRAQEAQQLGAPYQQGIGSQPSRYSLLYG